MGSVGESWSKLDAMTLLGRPATLASAVSLEGRADRWLGNNKRWYSLSCQWRKSLYAGASSVHSRQSDHYHGIDLHAKDIRSERADINQLMGVAVGGRSRYISVAPTDADRGIPSLQSKASSQAVPYAALRVAAAAGTRAPHNREPTQSFGAFTMYNMYVLLSPGFFFVFINNAGHNFNCRFDFAQSRSSRANCWP